MMTLLREPLHDIIWGVNYTLSDHSYTNSRHFQSHTKNSIKFVDFACPALYDNLDYVTMTCRTQCTSVGFGLRQQNTQ